MRRLAEQWRAAQHEAKQRWPKIDETPPWCAEILPQHEFAVDHKRSDNPMRCPRCEIIGSIEHGENRLCDCGLAMTVRGNALRVWTDHTPSYAIAMDRKTPPTTVLEIEPNQAMCEYTAAPSDAAILP